MGKEALAEPVRSSESPSLPLLSPSKGPGRRPALLAAVLRQGVSRQLLQLWGYSRPWVIPTLHALLSPSTGSSAPGLGGSVHSRVTALCAPWHSLYLAVMPWSRPVGCCSPPCNEPPSAGQRKYEAFIPTPPGWPPRGLTLGLPAPVSLTGGSAGPSAPLPRRWRQLISSLPRPSAAAAFPDGDGRVIPL